MKTSAPTPKQLSNLVPLNDATEEMRAAILPYANLHKLSAMQELIIDRSEQSAYLLSGSVTPTEEDARALAPVIAEQWQAFEPNHALEPVKQYTAGDAGAEVVTLDRKRVGTLLAWGQLAEGRGETSLPPNWLDPILRSELLARLPGENLQTVLSRVHQRNVTSGETVVREGQPGEEYFLILEGEFSVSRDTESGLPLLLAHLGPGDSFGEEALLGDTVRNASVEADTDGCVLSLSKADFLDLVGAALHRSITAHEAISVLDAGGVTVIDVRTGNEFGHDHLDGAKNIPLAELRDARDKLKRDERYLLVCDSGRRSATAAFLFSEWGLHAESVSGGLLEIRSAQGNPAAERANVSELHDVLETVDSALDDAVQERAAVGQVVEEPVDEDRTDPFLRAKLDETQVQLKRAQHAKLALEAKIREVRAKAAEDFASLNAMRARLQAEADRLLAEERQRLRAEYDRATKAIAELQAQKAEIDTRAREQHASIDSQANSSRDKLVQQAAEVHRALLQTRDEALARERSIRSKQSKRESELIEATESRLKAERQRLESQVAQAMVAIQKAEQRLEFLETERLADKQRAAAHAKARREQRQQWRREMHEKIAAASADGGIEGEDEALRLAQMAASEESLRLRLHSEVEALLEDEKLIAERREDEAKRKLEHVAAKALEAEKRAVQNQEAEHNMLADIQAQLGDSDVAIGRQAYAQQRAQLIGEATDDSAQERKSAEEALARARAHIARLKGAKQQ